MVFGHVKGQREKLWNKKKCTSEWILEIDADEIVSKEFKKKKF